MKIIGHKDYYDYLSGIYGIDPKIVLDRRKTENYTPIGDQVLTFYICGYKIQGLHYDGEFYYGNKLAKIGKEQVKGLWYKRLNSINGHIVKTYVIKKRDNVFGLRNHNEFIVEAEIYRDPKNHNKKEGCPILLSIDHRTKFNHFPLLSKYNLGAILPPETIYQWLVEWISTENNEKENIFIPMTDIEKIQAKGFDKKTSFRNIK